jgi:ATP-binding cassette subfamily F protein 3
VSLLAQAAGIAHAHGGNQIFTGLGFEVKQGDRLALIGENGAGKSTLFRILARQLKPDAGLVTYRRGLTVGYLTQHSSLDSSQTAWQIVAAAGGDPDALELRLFEIGERLASALDDDELADLLDEQAAIFAKLEAGTTTGDESAATRILTGLGFPEDRWQTSVGRLSGGEKKIVALARILLDEPELLLLDEPDNHLDERGKGWLEQFILDHTGGVAVISHDRYLIDRIANQTVELEDGRIVAYPGNYSSYLVTKRERLGRESQLRELQEREFKKLKASAEALTQWARQNPKFASRAENMRRRVAEERSKLDATPRPVLERKRIDVDFAAERGSTLVLEAKHVAKRFGSREVFKPFDVVIRHGERIGLVGPNGAGKTTFFRLVQGLEEPTSGVIRLGANIVVGYYAQEQETLDPKMTPLELVRKLKPLNEQQALSFLVGFLFDRDDTLNPIANLSGGERSRLQIATLILRGANFLLLDEPTNNLDLASIEELEEALLDFPGAILTISHDRYYLDKLCTRIIELNDGIVRDYPGGFSYYAANREKGTELTVRPPAPPVAVPARRR